MNKKIIALPALALSLLLPASLALGGISASANSAPPYWEGTTGAGVIVTGKQCPVEVESELLTLNIPRLPERSYSSQEEFEEYDATVTAKYTFYNPTEMAVKMDLLFPFGRRPEYAFAGYDAAAEASSYFDDTARYQITADGAAVERTLRYTYAGRAFAVDDIYSVSDEKREDGFYLPDLSVTKYQYTVDFPQKGGSGAAEFVLKYNPARTRILCGHYRHDELKNGDMYLYLYADTDRNSTFGFTVVGAEPEILSTAVKKDGFSWNTEEWTTIKGAAVRELAKEQTTFEEYIEAARPEGVGEVDFYNGALDRLVNFSYSRNGLVSFEPSWLRAEDFMRWYSYSLEIPAGERLQNEVTAPLYPAIYNRRCEYEYLLSPAQKWADFGTLEIVINTGYEIEDASLDFSKREGGYTLTREGLPLGELTFEIGGDYSGGYSPLVSAWGLVGTALVITIAVGAAVCLAGVIIGVVFGVKYSRKKPKK